MKKITEAKEHYLNYCRLQRRLDEKTLRAYRIDLEQFCSSLKTLDISQISRQDLENYIEELHSKYKPRTAKRKISSARAFFRYLEFSDIISSDPFRKIQTRFREPSVLPRTIPLNDVEALLMTIHEQRIHAGTAVQRRNALRDAAVCELLFATGLRISELCGLTPENVNLASGIILIRGKGSKERRIPIGNKEVIRILSEYAVEFQEEIRKCDVFFVGRGKNAFSDQAIRRMIRKYEDAAACSLHITPHMFRHTYATALLDEGVDIRCIQELLGHSSISVTEIYTHVATSKQEEILSEKHPRKKLNLKA